MDIICSKILELDNQIRTSNKTDIAILNKLLLKIEISRKFTFCIDTVNDDKTKAKTRHIRLLIDMITNIIRINSRLIDMGQEFMEYNHTLLAIPVLQKSGSELYNTVLSKNPQKIDISPWLS